MFGDYTVKSFILIRDCNHNQNGGKKMDDREIRDIIQMYFDASFTHAGEKMLEAFHSGAHIYGLDAEGALTDTTREAFAARVSSHKTGGSDIPFPRVNEIISIEFTGENTAVARVKLRVMNTMFTDILSFVRVKGKWGIIAKVLSGVPVE